MATLVSTSVSAIGSSSGCRGIDNTRLAAPYSRQRACHDARDGRRLRRQKAFGSLLHKAHCGGAERRNGGRLRRCGLQFRDQAHTFTPAGITRFGDADRFVSVMQKWQANLEADLDNPILGASVEQLKSIDCPVCIIPGNDKTLFSRDGPPGAFDHCTIGNP
ncbi:MAG: hypothetical protein WDN50_19090 [Bradyrhizobium sp.]